METRVFVSGFNNLSSYMMHHSIHGICMYMRVLTKVSHDFSSKFKAPDVASSVSRGAPEFCNVYIISKGKISSLRSATSSPGPSTRMHTQHSQSNNHLDGRFMPPSAKGLIYPPYIRVLLLCSLHPKQNSSSNFLYQTLIVYQSFFLQYITFKY